METAIIRSRFENLTHRHEAIFNDPEKDESILSGIVEEMADLYALALVKTPIQLQRQEVHNLFSKMIADANKSRFAKRRLEELRDAVKTQAQNRKDQLFEAKCRVEALPKTGFQNPRPGNIKTVALENLTYAILDDDLRRAEVIRKKLFDTLGLPLGNLRNTYDCAERIAIDLTLAIRRDLGKILMIKVPTSEERYGEESPETTEALLTKIDEAVKGTRNETLSIILYGPEINEEWFNYIISKHDRVIGAIKHLKLFRHDFGGIIVNTGIIASPDTVLRDSQKDFNERLFNIEIGPMLSLSEINWNEVLKLVNKYRELQELDPLTLESIKFRAIQKTLERNLHLGKEFVCINKDILFRD